MVYEEEVKKFNELREIIEKSGLKELDDLVLDELAKKIKRIGKAENNPRRLGILLKRFNRRLEEMLGEKQVI